MARRETHRSRPAGSCRQNGLQACRISEARTQLVISLLQDLSRGSAARETAAAACIKPFRVRSRTLSCMSRHAASRILWPIHLFLSHFVGCPNSAPLPAQMNRAKRCSASRRRELAHKPRFFPNYASQMFLADRFPMVPRCLLPAPVVHVARPYTTLGVGLKHVFNSWLVRLYLSSFLPKPANGSPNVKAINSR